MPKNGIQIIADLMIKKKRFFSKIIFPVARCCSYITTLPELIICTLTANFKSFGSVASEIFW